MLRKIFALRHPDAGRPIIIITVEGDVATVYQHDMVTTDVADARVAYLAATDIGFRRDRDLEASLVAQEARCDAGECDHYSCTEGRSLNEWVEPEPTLWDYQSEAFAGTIEN